LVADYSWSRAALCLSQASINLADNEARLQGFQLDSYERPKIDHSAVKRKWTLFYGLKKSETGTDSPAMFSATVEDKTHQVEIRK